MAKLKEVAIPVEEPKEEQRTSSSNWTEATTLRKDSDGRTHRTWIPGFGGFCRRETRDLTITKVPDLTPLPAEEVVVVDDETGIVELKVLRPAFARRPDGHLGAIES